VEGASFERVLDLASTYGYGFLFLISVAENIFLLGFVVPGDVAVVLAGGLAAWARLQLGSVLLAVVAGVVLGSNISFWIGRRGGSALLERWGERFLVDKSRVERVEIYFTQHGAKTVFLASFVSGLKNLVPAVAGASRMSVGRFVIYNAAGSTVRAAGLILVGYVFGANLPTAFEWAGRFNVWLLVAVAVLLVFLAVRAVRKSRRFR
jgi:membrane protein DedA with SNARE-associated domain